MTKGAQIIKLLKAVDTESVWGTGISLVIQTKDADRVMDLIIDLRDQARDNPRGMKEILGEECFRLIMAI